MFMGKVDKPQQVTARFALVGQPCQRPYRVRVRVMGYRESQVLRYLVDYAAKHETAPRYEDICCATGIGGLDEVSRIVIRLESYGELAEAGYYRAGGQTWGKTNLQRANRDASPPVVNE
jgi:hypothetical protein